MKNHIIQIFEEKKFWKLYQIHQDIRADVAMYKSDKSLFVSTFVPSDPNNFSTKIIGEVKLASPKFDNSRSVDPEEMIKFYIHNADVSAISFLLNKKYFKGNLECIRTLKELMRSEWVKKPLFYKEFVIATNQIDQASGFGFDACLLIYKQLKYVAAEENMTMIQFENYIKNLVDYANSKNIFTVLEVDNIDDMWHVLAMNMTPDQIWLGVNARALDTPNLITDKNIHLNVYNTYHEQMSPYIRFAFSWVEDLAEVAGYNNMYHACLIGTYFSDTFAKLKIQQDEINKK